MTDTPARAIICGIYGQTLPAIYHTYWLEHARAGRWSMATLGVLRCRIGDRSNRALVGEHTPFPAATGRRLYREGPQR